MKNIFSAERVNTGRQLEFDLDLHFSRNYTGGSHIYSKYLKERTEAFFGRHRVFWTVFVWTMCIASFILATCMFDEYPNFMNDYNI